VTGDPILPQLFHTKVNRFWLPSRGWLPRRMTGRETVEWCGMCTGIIAKLQSFCRLPYSLFPPSIDEIPYLDQLLRPHCDVTGRGLMRGTISNGLDLSRLMTWWPCPKMGDWTPFSTMAHMPYTFTTSASTWMKPPPHRSEGVFAQSLASLDDLRIFRGKKRLRLIYC